MAAILGLSLDEVMEGRGSGIQRRGLRGRERQRPRAGRGLGAFRGGGAGHRDRQGPRREAGADAAGVRTVPLLR